MVLTIALALQAYSNLPENAGFDYSGLPTVSGNLHAQTHGASVATSEDSADFTSTTVYKNPGAAGTVTLTLPRRRIGDATSGNPTFAINASWDGRPINLASAGTKSSREVGKGEFLWQSDLSAPVHVARGGTHVLRVKYRVDVGKCGFDRKQHLVGYWLDGDAPLDMLSLSYPYGGRTVFRLPEVFPGDFDWQVGQNGAYVRKTNFTPSGQLTFITFYFGGFKPIGDPSLR